VIVADVIATVEPDVIETVLSTNEVPDVPTSPRAITVPPEVVKSKNDAVPVAAAVAEVIALNVATALVLALVATVNTGDPEQVNVARIVPALAVSATAGLVPE
jgi:hypothetical protein